MNDYDRDKFEKFVRGFHIGSPLDSYSLDGEIVYEDWNVQTAWRVWQESRKNVKVEFPSFDPFESESQWDAVWSCKYELRQVGVDIE